MANIPRCEVIKLTKPTNTLRLSKEVSRGRISAYLMHEDREIIKPLKVKSFSGNEILLTEMVNPESVEHYYGQECIGDYLDSLGKTIRENIFVEVFYEA